jgi:hypothetical protein
MHQGVRKVKRNQWLTALALGVGLGLTLTLLWLLARQPDIARADPDILFVAADGNDTNDCSTIANRCRTVQRAVDLAADSATIKVATGIYTDTDMIAAMGYVVVLTKTVTLRGGYDASFADPPDPNANPTTLDAQDAGRVLSISGAGPTIEGLIITGGYGDYSGGGIKVEGAYPIISDNLIVGNSADGDGGAIFVNGGSAQILNNRIIDNTATWAGGLRIINDADVTIVGNEIVSNVAQISGGGIDLECCGGTTPLIAQNLIAYNDGGTFGGGVKVDATHGRLVNNILARNQADDGAGLWLDSMVSYPISTTLIHNTWVGDPAGGEGVWVGSYVTATLVNNIIVSHTTGITNTVPASSTVTADYSLFDGNVIDYGSGVSSTNEVSGAVAFVAPATGDYHIGSGSAAIDAGVDTGVTDDIDGDPRSIGLAPDIGADEFAPRIYLPLVLKQY